MPYIASLPNPLEGTYNPKVKYISACYDDVISDVCGTPRRVKIDYKGYDQDGEVHLTQVRIKKLEPFIMSGEDLVLSFMDYFEQRWPTSKIDSEVKVVACLLHGDCNTKEYRSYKKMIERCYNPKSISFPRYGAKGIKVCRRWLNSYENFLSDMGRAPSPEHSIDRINSKNGYHKKNCRWATVVEQNNNKKNIIKFTINGLSKTRKQWALYLGIDPKVLYQRMSRGWSIEKAIKEPLRKWRLNVDDVKLIRQLRKEGHKRKDLAKKFNITGNSIYLITSNKAWKDDEL